MKITRSWSFRHDIGLQLTKSAGGPGLEGWRMRRAAEDHHIAIRRWKTHRKVFGDHGWAERDINLEELGRWRKTMRVGGCRKSRCHVCHPSKILGYPTRQEEEAYLRHREELIELGLDRLARRQRCRSRANPSHLSHRAFVGKKIGVEPAARCSSISREYPVRGGESRGAG